MMEVFVLVWLANRYYHRQKRHAADAVAATSRQAHRPRRP
jgi:hypothetical protein